MTGAEMALDRLTECSTEVSAHWLIAEDGRLWRLVDERARAWHAGVSAWGDVRDINSRSIGIELANSGPIDGFQPFTEPQMRALEGLLDDIFGRWSIPRARVLGHSDVAPGRKADPGPKFDWRRLALGGRAVWPEADGGAEARWDVFRAAAARVGYRPSGDDWEAVLAAFRLRFRPWGSGAPLEGADVATICALAASYPCVDAAPVRS
jgi:N-acetylmuramoyl-L-alanine amidase